MGIDGVGGDDRSLQHLMRAEFEEYPVLESARLALIGVYAKVDRLAGVPAQEAPLHAGREARAAATAQVAFFDLRGHLIRGHLPERFSESLIAAGPLVARDGLGTLLFDVLEQEIGLVYYLPHGRLTPGSLESDLSSPPSGSRSSRR